MIKVGIIGTSWIAEEFRSACLHIPEVEVVAIYSRTKEKGESFATKNQIPEVYTDYDALLQGDHVDAMYIASPNALHFQQAMLALEAGKHVISEKAITSNGRELLALVQKAKEKGVVLMEAVKCLSMPTYHILKENLKEIGSIRKVFFNFCQYSSKYDAYLGGELPNIFNPVFSAGALMDIGIYCVYPCIDLFGVPQAIKSQVNKLTSGVDGSGTLLMKYDGFEAILNYSKINASELPSEIMGEKGSILIDHISRPASIELVLRGEQKRVISTALEHEPMYYEVREFIDAILNKEQPMHYTLATAQNVMSVLDHVRQANHIVFPADNN